MARDWQAVTEPELERALEHVGEGLAYPPVPDLALAVGARLRAAPSRGGAAWGLLRPVFRPAWQPTLRRVAAGLAAVVVLLSGLLVLSPSARRAVAGWLGLRGVRIDVVATPSLSVPSRLGGGLQLGRPFTLAEAQSRVSYRILLPKGSGLGSPDEVYVSTRSPGEVVSLVYRARPGLPASQAGVGLLLTEFRARLDGELISQKVAGPGTRIESVTVNGAPGLWLEGDPHFLAFLDEEGDVIEDRTRLAGNVLLWEVGDLTLRIEADIGKDEALRIAESVG